jgi:hypothetical protein
MVINKAWRETGRFARYHAKKAHFAADIEEALTIYIRITN